MALSAFTYLFKLALYLTCGLIGAGVALAIAAVGFGWWFSLPPYRGPITDHFDGERFINPRSARTSTRQFWKWRTTRTPGPWRASYTPAPQPPPGPVAPTGELQVTFVNHSTVLIQQEGINVLTDPIWSKRASPFSWIGPARHHAPGLAFDKLPHIDVVLLSHNHYDHMDIPTLLRLEAAYSPHFYVPLGHRQFLERKGLQHVVEMDWGDHVPLSERVELHCVPAQHFSSRGIFDRNKTLWAGYVMTAPKGAVLFAGDTGMSSHFEQIHQTFPNLRLSIIPIGAYEPRWFMGTVHLAPEQAVEAHRILQSPQSLAIHFGTFRLADDGELQPVHDLLAALKDQKVTPQNFWVLAPGESRIVP